MGPKETILWISSLESNYKNINHSFWGVDCWPIVRNTLMTMTVRGKEKKPKVSRSLLREFFDFISLFKILFKFNKYDFLFLSDSKYSESILETNYNKDAYVVSEISKKYGKNALICLQDRSDDIFSGGDYMSLRPIIIISFLLTKLPFMLFFIPGFRQYVGRVVGLLDIESVQSTEVNSLHLKHVLSRNILFCLFSRVLLAFLLKITRPSKCFIHCYYSLFGMSFCAACNSLGIPVVDVQHGVSGRNMRAYSNWHLAASAGYTTLPSEFFAWTEFDTIAIGEWASSSGGKYSVRTVGNLWRNYMVESGLSLRAISEWKEFINLVFGYKYRIVVTLQSVEISDKLHDVFDAFGDDVCFLVRFHPDEKSLLVEEGIKKLFGKYHNLYYREPTLMPVQVLMSVASLHITEWSASIYDALYEGVATAVIDELGVEYFQDFVANNIVFDCSGMNGISTINNLLTSEKLFKQSKYFVSEVAYDDILK